jgi:hypothetical protein
MKDASVGLTFSLTICISPSVSFNSEIGKHRLVYDGESNTTRAFFDVLVSKSFSHLVGVGPLQDSTATSLTFRVHILARTTEAVVASWTTISWGKLPVVTHLDDCSLCPTRKQQTDVSSLGDKALRVVDIYPSKMLTGGKFGSYEVTAVTWAPSSSKASSIPTTTTAGFYESGLRLLPGG